MGQGYDIYDLPINPEEIAEGLKADLLDAGWHETNHVDIEERIVEKGANTGRPFFRLTPTFAGTYDDEGNLTERNKGRKLGFGVSPVLKLDKNGKPDFMFKLWSQLVSAVGGGANTREVMDKVDMTKLAIRTIQRNRQDTGEPESMVVSIRAAA